MIVGCECSGIVRRAFRQRGHDAWSCDLKPAEDGGEHIQGDLLKHLDDGWDLMIAHPECTYLTLAGVRHLHSIPSRRGNLPKIHGPERWKRMFAAADFFRQLLEADIDKICVENPVPHGYAVEEIGCSYNQLIHPWQFGHGEQKKTCLWLKNLPPLWPGEVVAGRVQRIHLMSPGKDRSANRSRTYTGIAEAMAIQWGSGLTTAAPLFNL